MTLMLDRITDAIACYRLTKLAIEDEITQPIRDRLVGDRNPDDSRWAYLWTCPWCMSIWVAAGIVFARRRAPGAWRPTAEVLAMSAITGWLAEHE